PVNRKYRHVQEGGVNIFVSTNGMHTDFIVPTQHSLFDWSQIISSRPFDKALQDYPYLGIGWGDPGFYLELEAWNKMTAKLATRAMLIPTSTIMHVTGYDQLPKQKLRVEKIAISKSQYVHLCSFIYSAFALKSNQEIDLIPNVGYADNDNFYKANGVYHAFHTCNYWVNKGLKKIGVRTALWSPLDRGIFYQLDKVKNKWLMDSISSQVPTSSPS
ncbi:MAG: TIGR02117 family protein, partial [Bacteroidota bacterium]